MNGYNICDVCDEEISGSHYHCANCGAVSSMMGHYVPAKNAFICLKIERKKL